MSRSGSRVKVGALLILAIVLLCLGVDSRVGDVVAALPAGGDEYDARQRAGGPRSGSVSADARGRRRCGRSAGRRSQSFVVSVKSLDAREEAVAEREQQLMGDQAPAFRAGLEELKAERERLAETAALVDDAAGKDVQRLARDVRPDEAQAGSADLRPDGSRRSPRVFCPRCAQMLPRSSWRTCGRKKPIPSVC